MFQRLMISAAASLLAFSACAQDARGGPPKAPAAEQQKVVAPNLPAATPGQGQAAKPGQNTADAAAKPAPKPTFSANDMCVTDTSDNDFGRELTNNTHPMGEAIVTSSRYLPTGQRVDIGVRRSYTDGLRYFAAYENPAGTVEGRRIFDKGEVLTRRAIPSDNLVKAKLLNADEAIVTLELDADDPGWWAKKVLYVYTCLGSPTRVSQTNVVLSPRKYSLWITGAIVVVVYAVVGFLLRQRGGGFQGYFGGLNPARLSAGPDGRASLSKFQVIGFSLLVFALLLLLLLQTGELSDLNVTILGLLGINGFGATIAKGADGSRNVLTPDNRAWLIQHNWLRPQAAATNNANATWRDFFTTDGEFDVYRFQSFIFSLVIGASMVIAGVGQLSSFSVPETILGIVGLSQAVYIGGKIVTPTTMKALNDSLDDLRDREKRLRATALTSNNSQPIATLAALQQYGGNDYNDFKAKATEVRAFYTSETGVGVQNADLEPIP